MKQTEYFGAKRSTSEHLIKEAREERYGKAYQGRTPDFPVGRDHDFYHQCLKENGKDATMTKWACVGIIGGLAHCYCGLEFGVLPTVVMSHNGRNVHVRVNRKGGGAMPRRYNKL